MRYSQVKQPVATIAGVNNELEKIANSIDDMVSRKAGDGPNTLDATLDANSQRIINLPEPQTNLEPVRKADFDELGNKLRSDVYTAVRDAEDATDDAIAATNSANAAASNANSAADNANIAADNAYQAIADLESDGYAVINQIESDGKSALDALRVINVGSFEDGATLTARNEVLYYLAEQTYYRWDGALPKTVPPASTPASTGGVGAGAWVNVGQAELASALADAADSANRVARMAITADSLKDLANAPRIANRQYSVKGFYTGSDVGGGMFYWDASCDKADHNGGTIIDPDRIDAWDGTSGDLTTLFSTGEGTGCFIRANCSTISPDMFGGSLNQIVDSGAYQSHQVFVDTETTVTAPMELVHRGLDFGRRRGRVTFSGVHNPDGAAITLPRGPYGATERTHLNGMYAHIPSSNDVQNMLHINVQSAKIDWLRVDGYGCPGGIIKIEDAWGTTLRDVGIYVGGPGPGIVLEGSNGGLSIVDCYITATHGKGIVVNGGGRSMSIEGIIEGLPSPSNPDHIGLEINKGGVCVNCYFENRRVVVNGGSVYFGPRTSSTAPNRMYEINGGDSVVFDGVRITDEDAAAYTVSIDIASGMEGKVNILETCRIQPYSKVRSKSYIPGYYAGENLLTDPYFSDWTDDTLNSYPITFWNTYNNSYYRYEKDTTHVQSGKYSLTVYRDADPSRTDPITQGIMIDVSEVLTKIPDDGKVTLGLWIRMEDVEGFSPGDARAVINLLADDQILGSSIGMNRNLLGDGFVFLNGHYTIPEGTEDLKIRILGSLNVQETTSFTIDRMGIVAGHHPINVPFKM